MTDQIKNIVEGIRAGNRRQLARAITLSESTRPDDLQKSQAILQDLMPGTGNSVRIGITGVPGAGKSTFIEAMGKHLIGMGKKLAVLAVDPSSPFSGGSILGDKTRMQEISKTDSVFIRPSPTAGALGGVGRKTRESILLCEAAGYEVIFVETVGVGQSEFEVSEMVDFFLMLMLPNAGDSLQGIKRGIMELADLIVVNKADGDFVKKAEIAASDYRNALHLTRKKHPGQETGVLTCSSIEGTGIPEIWDYVMEATDRLKADGWFHQNRNGQAVQWTRRLAGEMLLSGFWKDAAVSAGWEQLQQELKAGKITAWQAGMRLIELFKVGDGSESNMSNDDEV